MTMLTSIMMLLSVILVMVMVPRIYGNWLQFKEYAELMDLDGLSELQTMHNGWVIRHMCLALIALGFVVAIKYLPGLESYSQTAAATAAYSAISFTFAFIESLLAQKISVSATSMLQPVKEPRDNQRFY